MLSQAFLNRQAADGSILGWCRQTALAFSIMQGQQSLMLRWRLFLGHGSDVDLSIFG